MDDRKVDQDQTVEEVFNKWPKLIFTFLDHKLDCVGCYMAKYCSIKNVLQSYDLDTIRFLGEVSEVMDMDKNAKKSNHKENEGGNKD